MNLLNSVEEEVLRLLSRRLLNEALEAKDAARVILSLAFNRSPNRGDSPQNLTTAATTREEVPLDWRWIGVGLALDRRWIGVGSPLEDV